MSGNESNSSKSFDPISQEDALKLQKDNLELQANAIKLQQRIDELEIENRKLKSKKTLASIPIERS